MDGDSPLEHLKLARAASRSKRVQMALGALLVLLDLLMLTSAFVLGYQARHVLPFFPLPETPTPFERYIGTLILHVLSVVVIFYISRLYHLPRITSRIDQLQKILEIGRAHV